MTEKTDVDIAGLDKAAVLAALYNVSSPQGMGFLHFDPQPMTVDQARAHIWAGDDHQEMFDALKAGGAMVPERTMYFDYLKGRVLKVNLVEDSFDPRLFDRDNGEGAAASAIQSIREQT